MADRASPSAGSSSKITIPRALVRWWRQNLPRLGLTRASGMFLGEMWEFLREATPGRRKQRYGDIDFDWDYRVDTTSANVSRRADLLAVLTGHRYQPSDPAVFHESIRSLAIDYNQFQFIDLGSGKGRTLLMASEYPFQRIVGVEAVPVLHRVALENIRKYRSATQKCLDLESLCGDARDFQFPPEPLVVFLFNPLPEAGLRVVMENLQASLREHPRPLYVVYHNPLLEHVLAEDGGLRRLRGDMGCAIYAFPFQSNNR
ncbi:MAG TPA: class I SAM-dependent methyltransferase [Terriglobales bacterium]|nr:class I SAM-dependent methyltransferase [Terriglobales bacterium]